MGSEPSLFSDPTWFEFGSSNDPFWLKGIYFTDQLAPGAQDDQELTLHLILRLNERPTIGYQYMIYALPNNLSDDVSFQGVSCT